MRVCNNLRSSEVQQMCAILGDVLAAYHAGTPGDAVQHLAERMGALFRADICMLGEVPRGAGPTSWSRLSEWGWAGHDQRQTLISGLERSETADPALRAALDRATDCLTLTRRELIDDDAWYGSAHVSGHRRPAGLDDELVSVWTNGPRQGWAGVILLHRLSGQPPFDDAEAGLLDVLHRQLAPMIWAAELIPPVTLGPGPDIGLKPPLHDHGLTPAQLRVVPYILQGYREEEIAVLLCRSRHTIHDHVMAVYKAFGVHSRADLIVKLANGRGPAAAAVPEWWTVVPPADAKPSTWRAG